MHFRLPVLYADPEIGFLRNVLDNFPEPVVHNLAVKPQYYNVPLQFLLLYIPNCKALLGYYYGTHPNYLLFPSTSILVIGIISQCVQNYYNIFITITIFIITIR
jgi:hypothetical protein